MLAGEIQTIATPKDLAILLSRRARLLAGAALADLGVDDESPVDFAYAQFKAELLTDIDKAEFADVYAETLTYGLFAARCLSDDKFTVASADRALREIPLLSSLFHDYEFRIDDNLRWILDEIVALLDAAPIAGITDYFANRSGRADPMLDFYEPFLAAFDPRKREARGVYYTPEPVVGYMVRSVAALLERDFNRKITDKEVRVLDPATGTGSFLFAVADEIHRQIVDFDAASWNAQTVENTLARLFGLELMVAPYTIAHLKLRLQFGAWGTPPRSRVGIYLSNTLDDPRGNYGGTVEMVKELKTADQIKSETEILVVIGNPPYAGHSANVTKREVTENTSGAILRKGKAASYSESRVVTKHNEVGARVESYKFVDGVKLSERNLKWLQNDYVKFLAFAQNRIARTGEGIVAYITDRGYLDNSTFRGLRANLMDEFDALYVLDLHGSAKKKEKSPDGSADQNVFAIQQGVAILLAVKTKGSSGARASVYHADLWGRKKEKEDALGANDVLTTAWQTLTPKAPHYLFLPRDETHLEEYKQGWKITDVFNQNGEPAPGFVTTQDQFAISFSADEAKTKVKSLLASKDETDARKLFRLCSQDQWNYANAKRDLAVQNWESEVIPVLYRPFDTRWTIWNSHVAVHRRERVNKHMIRTNNIALCTVRGLETPDFEHVFVSDIAMQHHTVSIKEVNYIFPLYLYVEPKSPTKEQTGTLAELDLESVGLEKRANLNPKFVAAITSIVGVAASPEAIFDYIYATLHRPDYRAKYAAFLKTDFPRIPLPRDGEQFEALRSLGARLVALHLLDEKRAPALAQSPFKPVGEGDNIVSGARYDEAEQTIGFNATRGFAPVSRAVWEFKIGGYQVAKKWLDDRKGRALEFEELQHYAQVLAALQGTIEAMAALQSLAREG